MMTNAINTQTKPKCRVGVLGHVQHGKTSLTAAITKVMAETRHVVFPTYDQFGNVGEEYACDPATIIGLVDYKTDKHDYDEVDCFGGIGMATTMVGDAGQMDGAILVVSATDGPMPQTREHIWLARQAGVPALVVFMNKVDLVDDLKVELVEAEMRDILSSFHFSGHGTAIIKGSATCALESKRCDIGEQAVLKLMGAVCTHIPRPLAERGAEPSVGYEVGPSNRGAGRITGVEMKHATIRFDYPSDSIVGGSSATRPFFVESLFDSRIDFEPERAYLGSKNRTEAEVIKLFPEEQSEAAGSNPDGFGITDDRTSNSTHWERLPEVTSTGAQERAATCLAAALRVLTRDDTPLEWATIQNSLGVFYLQRSGGDRADNLERAIACFEAALTIRTLDTVSGDWATTLRSLASAYRERLRGNRTKNLEQAMACYDAARAAQAGPDMLHHRVFDKQAAWDAL